MLQQLRIEALHRSLHIRRNCTIELYTQAQAILSNVEHCEAPEDAQQPIYCDSEEQRAVSKSSRAQPLLHDQFPSRQPILLVQPQAPEDDKQPIYPDSEEQRVVYKSSPTQRAPSEPPEAGPSLSGRQISADEGTLRQRLISAVQRPSGSDTAGQLGDTFSLRYAEGMHRVYNA